MPEGEQLVNKSTKVAVNEYKTLLTKCLSTTMRYTAEIVLVILAFISYASLQKGALKIQLQPIPVPFFNGNSSVNDFYFGEISTPFTTVINSDISLVMYYAPWDFDSQLAKSALDEIALKYSEQIYVAALNCWVPNGDCRQHFPKIRSFPLILGYVGGNKGVQYRGPLQFSHIEKFVQSLIRPLNRIESVSDLYKLMSQSNAVVTGYFNFSDTKPTGFYPFYVASLKYLEYDVYRTVQFATVTNPLAARKLGIDVPTFPSPKYYDIRLHLWNETLIFPHNASGVVDTNRLIQWVYHRSHSPVHWLSPTGHKSQLIQNYINDPNRPSLILFTPRVGQLSQAAMMVREVALDYNNCASSPRIARLIQEIQHQREEIETTRLAVEKQCSIFGGSRYCRRVNNSTLINSLPNNILSEEMCWPSSQSIVQPSRIQGLACKTNWSLHFYMMDAEQYQSFSFKLGYSKTQFLLNPNVVFIVDPKDESHFIMNHPLTRENIENLIVNFTQNSLSRFRRSRPTRTECPDGRICVQDISGSEFESVVLNSSNDVMVFYRKSNCVFCEVAIRFFLRVFQMFEKYPRTKVLGWDLPHIQFVTIDGEENDLPWQFTVDKYPTIVFYPAYRKMDSRMFPHDVELNVISLLNFTLSQLNFRKRVIWFIHFCRDVPCLQEAQRQIAIHMATIDQSIRTVRYRLLWSEIRERSLMLQLREWLKERRFYQELNYAILNSMSSALQFQGFDSYPEGIRPIET